MRTLDVTKGMHVYLSGYNGSPNRWEDLDGSVVRVDAENNLIAVQWVYRDGASDTFRYEADKFIATTDRNGVPVLVLALAVGQVG